MPRAAAYSTTGCGTRFPFRSDRLGEHTHSSLETRPGDSATARRDASENSSALEQREGRQCDGIQARHPFPPSSWHLHRCRSCVERPALIATCVHVTAAAEERGKWHTQRREQIVGGRLPQPPRHQRAAVDVPAAELARASETESGNSHHTGSCSLSDRVQHCGRAGFQRCSTLAACVPSLLP